MQKYFSFNGRADRQEFCAVWLLWILVNILAAIYGEAIAVSSVVVGLPIILFLCTMIFVFLAVACRRFHDMNIHGGFIWLYVIFGLLPLYETMAAMVIGYGVDLAITGFLLFGKGTDGENEYG